MSWQKRIKSRPGTHKYYDIFHEDEGEEERDAARGRPTVWEIHPVHKIEIIKN